MQSASPVISLGPRRLVIPVRYVAAGRIFQTTSTHLSGDGIEVLAPLPNAGITVGLKLYLPGSGEPVPAAAIAHPSAVGKTDSFWAEFLDLPPATRAQVALLMTTGEATGYRAFGRVGVEIPIVLRGRDGAVDGVVSNLSESGLFVMTSRASTLGRQVRGELQLIDSDGPQPFEADVVRVTERGAGLQFSGGSDDFRRRLTAYIASKQG